MILRFAHLSLLALILSSCVIVPRPPKIREPLWPKLTGSSQRRIHQNLTIAAAAWDQLTNPHLSAQAHAEAESAYEHALSEFLRHWGRRQLPRHWKNGTTFAQGESRFTVSLQPAPGHPQEISPLMFDRLHLADDVKLHKNSLLAEDDGLGVPLVGQTMYSAKLAAQYPMMPLNGGHLTLTAILEFSPAQPGQPRTCQLRLYNPLRQEHAKIGRRTVKLAANYTAPKKLALDEGFLKGFSMLGLLYPEKMLDDSQLYRLELYDPQRIPVVFVHGLMSDPHIWYNCINAIYADPVLRAHYQPWYFLYSTGLAVPANSHRLRESLREARRVLDPEADDASLDQMVLVGHSMGGLLSRMQVISSRDDFWNAFFTCPPEKLEVSRAALNTLSETLQFEAQPYVKRLIFITVPHRGSDLADRSLVYRLSSLIRLPVDSVLLAKELLSGNTDALSPQIRNWGAFSFLSLGTLSPRHPYFKALNAQPIPVPHHSIIGRVGKEPLELSSDRVVPYRSAHLDTGTEKVVPYWHGCVGKPEVVEEVRQRLHQHLRESGRLSKKRKDLKHSPPRGKRVPAGSLAE